MNSSKLLVISFYFPPFERVGGRRWAKHLKYLDKKEIDFTVLAGNFSGMTSPWDEDIEHFKHKIIRIPVKIKYPYYKRILPTSITTKIRWKISYIFWKSKELKYKGNLWDDSVGYEEKFYKKAKAIIIEKGISKVLLTVGPFSYAKILLKLRKEFPHIEIILDYRDPIDGSIQNLSDSKKQIEILKQNAIWKTVNKIITVNSELEKIYVNKVGVPTLMLPHCIDFDDFKGIGAVESKPGKTTFIYGGSLYSGLEKPLNSLVSFLEELHKELKNVELKVFTSQSGYEDIFNKCSFDVKVERFLPLNEYLNELAKSDYILQLRPSWSPNGISSKFFELFYFKKPVLYFGAEGDVSQFIVENSLGVYFLEDKRTEVIRGVLDGSVKNGINKRYDLKKHTFETLNTKLLEFLEL